MDYFPNGRPLSVPNGPLYAISENLSIYSRHIRQLVENFVGAVFRISPREMRAKHRSREEVAFARQVAMYLAHVAGGLPMTEVGRLFARDRTTVAHACAVVEDRRDDPVFDRALAVLEFALTENAKPPMGRRGGAR